MCSETQKLDQMLTREIWLVFFMRSSVRGTE